MNSLEFCSGYLVLSSSGLKPARPGRLQVVLSKTEGNPADLRYLKGYISYAFKLQQFNKSIINYTTTTILF